MAEKKSKFKQWIWAALLLAFSFYMILEGGTLLSKMEQISALKDVSRFAESIRDKFGSFTSGVEFKVEAYESGDFTIISKNEGVVKIQGITINKGACRIGWLPDAVDDAKYSPLYLAQFWLGRLVPSNHLGQDRSCPSGSKTIGGYCVLEPKLEFGGVVKLEARSTNECRILSMKIETDRGTAEYHW